MDEKNQNIKKNKKIKKRRDSVINSIKTLKMVHIKKKKKKRGVQKEQSGSGNIQFLNVLPVGSLQTGCVQWSKVIASSRLPCLSASQS